MTFNPTPEELAKLEAESKAREPVDYELRVAELEAQVKFLQEMHVWQTHHLEPGDILLIQAPEGFSNFAYVNKNLERMCKDRQVRVILVPHGFKPFVARVNHAE